MVMCARAACALLQSSKGIGPCFWRYEQGKLVRVITGAVLAPLKITIVKKNGFNNYMKSIGKLGGQNKVPRLANDRKIADKINTI